MMGSGFGAALGKGLLWLFAMVFVAGGVAVVALWALWHYVLSHVTIGWT